MKTLLTTGWNFMRIIRLIIGVAGLVFAIIRQDMLLGFMGGMFLVMAVFNVGCCSTGTCNVPANPKIKSRS